MHHRLAFSFPSFPSLGQVWGRLWSLVDKLPGVLPCQWASGSCLKQEPLELAAVKKFNLMQPQRWFPKSCLWPSDVDPLAASLGALPSCCLLHFLCCTQCCNSTLWIISLFPSSAHILKPICSHQHSAHLEHFEEMNDPFPPACLDWELVLLPFQYTSKFSRTLPGWTAHLKPLALFFWHAWRHRQCGCPGSHLRSIFTYKAPYSFPIKAWTLEHKVRNRYSIGQLQWAFNK